MNLNSRLFVRVPREYPWHLGGGRKCRMNGKLCFPHTHSIAFTLWVYLLREKDFGLFCMFP